MADLTLERIEKIRVDIEQNASDESYWDSRYELIEAAERGLTRDRKAAAFDALDAMIASGRVTLKRPIYNRDLRIVDYSGSRILVFHVDQLVDGIEQVDRMLKEPTDAQ